MNNKFIQRINTLYGDLWIFLVTYLGSMLLASGLLSVLHTSFNDGWIVIIPSTLMFAASILLLRQGKAKHILQTRSDTLAALAMDRQWEYGDAKSFEARVVVERSALVDVSEYQASLRNFITAPDWQYVDLEYPVWREDKYGRHKVASIYYAVMSAPLPRELPNVFFDSKKHRKAQFAKVFDRKQQHRLEGDFNNHFDTYFPENYTIDSLSFITPDVMEALVAAEAYDIEIVGSSVMIYGPLGLDVQGQLQDMSQKLAAIKQELMDNIKTYRDERLPYAKGREMVSVQGMSLKRRRENIWFALVLMAIYLAYLVFSGLN